MAALPRKRTASAVVFGLPGQERTDDDVRRGHQISFKLDAVEETVEDDSPAASSSSSDEDDFDQPRGPMQPRSSLLRHRERPPAAPPAARCSADIGRGSRPHYLGPAEEAAENAPSKPRKASKSAGRTARPPEKGSSMPALCQNRDRAALRSHESRRWRTGSREALAGLGQFASPRVGRGLTKAGAVVKLKGSAVPHPPPSEPPSLAKPASTIEWAGGSVAYDGASLTYLVNLYPQGAGKLRWTTDLEWATDGVQTEKFNLKLTFEPKNGWKFGSCDGDGTIELLGTGGERHVYTGQVDGPGAPGPQIHKNMETGVVSKPAPMLRAQGKGKMQYANGDEYTGQWSGWRREGQGRHRAVSGLHEGLYEGAWARDLRNGAGRYTAPDGSVLLGRWENNVPREGRKTWANGDEYDGWWSGRCETTYLDEVTQLSGRCTAVASFGSDGLRHFCAAHKLNDDVLAPTYRREGQGTMQWSDGGLYEGMWVNDKRHGKGVMRFGTGDALWSHGDVFEGTWRDGAFGDGFSGTMRFADGGLYEGKWFRGRQHNDGVYTYPNGDVFTGKFANGGRADGPGHMKYANGDDYEGCWVSDVRHGEGTMKYASGDAYTGTWKHGMYDVGERTFTETNDCYSGAWEADLPHGRGTMVYGTERGVMKPGDVYEGPWAGGDHADGAVVIRYANKDVYKGDYIGKLRHGQGRMEYSHGNIFDGRWVRGTRREGWVKADTPVGMYEGHWKDERPHGEGKMRFIDGGFYQGDWVHGLRHGEGVMSNGSWRSYSGGWKYDRFDGDGTLSDLRSCSTYHGLFSEGKKHGAGKELYGFIDAQFEGTWHHEEKSKGIFTFPDGTRWLRQYNEAGELVREQLLGDKMTWKNAAKKAVHKERKLISGEQEKISIREKYKDLECVGDESGKPIKTPSLLPHLGKSMHMNMGKQVPVAVAKPPRTPRGSPSPLSDTELPSFLRNEKPDQLAQQISDAAKAADLARPMSWGIEDTAEDAEKRLQQRKAEVEKHHAETSETLQRRAFEGEEVERQRMQQLRRAKKSQRDADQRRENMRRQASEDRESRTKLLDEDLLAEKIDRSTIHANAEGSIEPHSGVPELWNIDGTEVDLEQHYTLGEPAHQPAMRLFDSPCHSSHPRCVSNRPTIGTICRHR